MCSFSSNNVDPVINEEREKRIPKLVPRTEHNQRNRRVISGMCIISKPCNSSSDAVVLSPQNRGRRQLLRHSAFNSSTMPSPRPFVRKSRDASTAHTVDFSASPISACIFDDKNTIVPSSTSLQSTYDMLLWTLMEPDCNFNIRA